ncbi:MAG: class I adenylate-forming enzyme family protein [Blastococcus sp.]
MDISFLLRQPANPASRVEAGRPALHFGTEASLTHGELADRSYELANGLLGLGVGRGDRVALLMYNCLEYWLAYFAVTRLGAVVVRPNFRLSADELEYVLNDSGSSVVIGHPDLLERIAGRRESIAASTYITTGPATEGLVALTDVFSGDTSDPELPIPGADDPAMIMYTSGTTGRPKGARWTHGNTHWFSAMQLAEWGFTRDTVIFVAGPLYHVGALEDYSLPVLTVGGEVVFLESKGFDIVKALRIAEARKVTDLTLFPSMIYQMLQLEDLGTFDLSSVRRLFTGGDPLLPWAVEKIRMEFPDVDVVQVYGLTEGTPIAACSGGGTAFTHPATVGRAMPFCEITIRDDDGQVLPERQSGEVWTRSPANANVYWNKPDATADTFVDGWCRTGDLGTIEDGMLSITGRKKDMIRSGGENIYARELEDVLMRLEGVAEVAVIGVPDSKFTEAVCAVVVRRDGSGLEADDVVAHCTQHMASYKKPKHVVFVDSLPRTASHKMQKFKLREQFTSLGG